MMESETKHSETHLDAVKCFASNSYTIVQFWVRTREHAARDYYTVIVACQITNNCYYYIEFGFRKYQEMAMLELSLHLYG